MKNLKVKNRLFSIIYSIYAIAVLLPAFTHAADIKKVCGTIRELGACQYKSNSPVRASSALSSPITRFALNPTIIFTNEVGACGNQAKLSSANIYDKKGNLLCSSTQRLGCAAKRGTCLARYKADERRCDTRNVRRKAVKNTGDPSIFWKVASNVCYRVPDAGRCYNVKVRELCAGLVK